MPKAAEMTFPIFTELNGKKLAIGELTLDLKLTNGKIKTPTVMEIKRALRKVH